MLPISVCLIAKNEENCIEECLKRLRPYSWEIIVADTGSTDRTVELASRYADRILHFTWCNDFGAARNFVISQASHPFILNIDCDEFLLNQISEDEMTSLLTPFLSKKQEIGRISLRNPRQTNGTTTVSSESVGRFFHRDYFQYEGSVHEQVVPADPGRKAAPMLIIPCRSLFTTAAMKLQKF